MDGRVCFQELWSLGKWRQIPQTPSGLLFQVPSGSLLGKARLSMELGVMPPSISGQEASTGLLVGQGVTQIRTTFEKTPNPGQSEKSSVEEQPWKGSPRCTSIFFMGSSAWLALSGIIELNQGLKPDSLSKSKL